MSAPITYRADMCGIAKKVLADGESLAAVCCELDIARSTLYEWRDTYPEFKKSIESGLQSAQRVWEQIGRDGITGKLDKFSPSPWIFTLKNRFRDDYREDKEQKSDSTAVIEMLIDKLVE